MASEQDADHWRTRADEIRCQATLMSEPEARLGLIVLAEQYELLAEHSRQIAGDMRLEQLKAAAGPADANEK
jgi:hypothetical protein